MSTATYVGRDLVSGGAWLETATRRGTSGYFAGDATYDAPLVSYPTYIGGVTFAGWQLDTSGPAAPRLERPGGGAALAGRYYSATTKSFILNVASGDSAEHYVSIYAVDDVGAGRLQTYTLYDGDHNPLASHVVDYDFSGGVWITFKVSGTIEVEVSLQGGTPNSVTCAFAWDESEPPMATASGGAPSTVALSGSGGATAGGSSSASMRAAPVGTGGAAAGGSSSMSAAAALHGSGGATAGGSSSIAMAAALHGSGGVVVDCSATADSVTRWLDEPRGGVAAGGSSSLAMAAALHGSGGLTAGGSSSIAVAGASTVALSGAGGLTAGGSSPIAMAARVAGSGGVKAGGSTPIAVGGGVAYTFAPSGGARLGGSSAGVAVLLLAVDPFAAVLVASTEAPEPLDVDPTLAVLLQ